MKTATGARRGDKLREHILWVAKDVFLEMGFERASMDVVAARAETSKRSLYAHFENKEKLFLAVIELVRGGAIGKVHNVQIWTDRPIWPQGIVRPPAEKPNAPTRFASIRPRSRHAPSI